MKFLAVPNTFLEYIFLFDIPPISLYTEIIIDDSDSLKERISIGILRLLFHDRSFYDYFDIELRQFFGKVSGV